MRRSAALVSAALLLAIGLLLGLSTSGESSVSAPPCDRRPDHPKCQTTGSTTTAPPTTTAPDPGNGDDVPGDVRAAFWYLWYPENWSDCTALVCGGWHLPDTPFGSRYDDSYEKIRWDVDGMQRAKLHAGISSWHGPGTNTDARTKIALDAARDDGQHFQVTIYYELEGSTDPTVAKIQSDLSYLRANYANREPWLWKGGKPVIFVWTNDFRQAPCTIVDRWRQATNGWADWYVNMQVFSGYETCAGGPQAWHQYGEDSDVNGQPRAYWPTPWNSSIVVPEVWLMSSTTPLIQRRLSRFCDHLRQAAAESDDWFLITSWNEIGESTQIEPGFYGTQQNPGASWAWTFADAVAANGAGC